MNEENSSFDDSELSDDDLAVLQAFEARGEWTSVPSRVPTSSLRTDASSPAAYPSSDALEEDMLILFVSEVEEDISSMRRTLNQLEQDDQIQPSRFVPLQRAAHKIRGTAGAVECNALATIAHDVELLIRQIRGGIIFPVIGVNALTRAVGALEMTLESVVAHGKESEEPLHTLEADIQNLGIDLQQAAEPAAQEVGPSAHITVPLPHDVAPLLPSIPLIRVDERRIDQLILHSERLTEQRTALESAQAQAESAIRDLHAAQGRLQQLEPALPSILASRSPQQPDQHPTSSLIARILNEATQRRESHSLYKLKSRSRLIKAAGSLSWDELDMERYSEKDMLIRALREAIADVAITSARVRAAFAHLDQITQEYVSQASAVRSDILLLRLTPLSTLVPRLQRAITMSATGQEQHVQFEVTGDATEIDQGILDGLSQPLLQLLRTCIADTFSSPETGGKKEPYRIWFRANGSGNEIQIEIGFSMTVHGGALEAIREPIQRLNGSISLQRNPTGGVSFHLRLPRSHSAAHCLQVRTGSEHVIVPFAQVQRISDKQREWFDIVYRLNELLGFPEEPAPATWSPHIQPILIMAQSMPQGASRKVVGVAVDEVIGEVELVVKPLTSYLQRPGIAGAAIDGRGHVLLMVDLPELISHYAILRRNSPTALALAPTASNAADQQPKILVADDSVYLRQSLLQTLQHENYVVMEARDGMEALEQLMEHTPDVFLLDIEMPNLNGYDVLSIMRLYPELAGVKIIMLTSRSSAKHMQRARELGADAYLTKPCSQETLLEQIRQLLSR